MREEWREIAGTGGFYEVSSLGRVRSWKNGKWGRGQQPRIMRPGAGMGPRQYPGVVVDCGSGRRTYKLHTLVAEAFLGPRPAGMEICHCDGDPFNNAAANLRYDTPLANAADKVAHGTQRLGESHPLHKLQESQVLEIRTRLTSGATLRGLGLEYGVAAATISDIKAGRTWAHLDNF